MLRFEVGLIAAALVMAWKPCPAAAQFGVGPGPFGGRVSGAADQPRVQPPMDRTLSRGMARAQQSIDAGEYALAIRFLDEALGRDGDVFIETESKGGYAGMKERARQMIRDLPPEGRQAYEAAYGPLAARALAEAFESGNAVALARVAQRYFYTSAGYEAALLAAAEEADAGRHLAAALLYEQLLDTPEAVRRYDPSLSVRAASSWLAAGEPARAAKTLAHLTARGAQTIEVGGREQRLDATASPLDWLRDTVGQPSSVGKTLRREWITYRGNGARSGETDGGLPHMRVRWRVRLMNHPRLEELFEDFQANLVQSGDVAPVASAPLAAGDYVLVRTPHGLLAVDFRTGKRVWRAEQRDRELERLVRGGADEEAANPESVRSFGRRIWQDYLYGVPSSDGARVYMIRDVPMPQTLEYDAAPWIGGSTVDLSRAANRLCAYDLATQGKLVWEIDGASVKGDLAGAFFLGAPLAVGPSLYALVEIKGEVFLAALDRGTGELEWRQQLANLETNVLMDLDRRLQSAMPSYDAGMLVCPTDAGLIVGVDLAKRSLAWAYRYDAKPRVEGMYRPGVEREHTLSNHWTDGAATLVDGRVLITPPESQEIHCLELRTGKLLWKAPRNGMQRLACVHNGTILLVGNKGMTGLRLSDGKPAWRKAVLPMPEGASPSGSGFLTDGKYFLPLTTADVAAVDVSEGRIVGRAAARDGEPLGNLICHRGSVISQNGMFLDCFDQIDVLRRRSEKRLVKHPDDVEALRTLGEVAYNDGRLSEAIELLERAYGARRDDLQTHDVLAECLTSALWENFAAYRDKLPLLKELEDGVASRRLSILQIESQGLLAAGEPLASAEACFDLYRLAGPTDEMLEVGRDLRVTASRWVAGQLAAAWQGADASVRKSIDETVLELAAAATDDKSGSLERFLRFFGTLPATEKLKLEQAQQWTDERRILEAQQLLLDLRHSDDESIRAEATARLAQQLHAAGQHTQAADWDRELKTAYGDVKCLGGATGRKLVEQWAAAAGVEQAPWPTGKVEVANVPHATASAAGRVRPTLRSVRWERSDEILGRTGAFVSAASRGGEFVMQDGLGREFFRAVLEQ
jgi:outer membrane protein assembly factor BamB